MLGKEENDSNPSGSTTRKTYWRSVSWSDRSPSNPNPRPSSKSRACLPPLQPLSISRRSVEEWPKAGSDDLGEWPNHPSTPSSKPGFLKPLENFDSSRPPQPREFQLKKDKLAFFDKECSRIADHIYLGSEAVAKNREILRENGITHVLNCVGFVCPEYFKNDLVYKTLWLQDSPSEDITSILYDVFDYFEDVREQGGRVLVHCCQGISRSTSLVIAYLMWRDGQSFENAFQYVKSARGVTNPNMGFACQLLQCQKRVLAVPVSPSSVLRMHRMAPHSPYDPLHLVPKLLNHPGPLGLDSRGAFLVHVPSAIYVWIGKNCNRVMADNARVSASQVIRYERAKGPFLIVEEGKETSNFWDALVSGPLLVNDGDKEMKVREDVNSFPVCPMGKNQVEMAINIGVGNKKVVEYDVDFEIFRQALSGGVIPLLPSSGTGSETCLPARENGWGRLRQKFASGFMKELVTTAKSSCDTSHTDDLPLPNLDVCNEPEPSFQSTDPFSSPSSPCGSPDSFSCYLNRSPESSSKSPSLSPSDRSSLFTFSPASSRWSNSSSFSSQPSPSSTEFREPFPTKLASCTEHVCFPCKSSSPSLAERRGSIPPSLSLMQPGDDDPPQVSKGMLKSWSFSIPSSESDLLKYIESYKFEKNDFNKLDERARPAHPFLLDADSEEITDENDLISDDIIPQAVDLSYPILFQWPSIEKVDMLHTKDLASRSVFLMLSPDLNKKEGKTLYIWVGRDAQFEKRQDCCWEKVGCKFLNEMGLPVDTPMQIIKEGEEPQQFLDHLTHFQITE
ncbi:Protein-tyrosine-phosphatase mkp1 [Thalictrum thalictroides]|uniref:Protein-tyrosine-phosphatase mkp1 n=1 Tax=Thalictrum thalictroides TaxID=46969 RepID=A0A7J6XCI9_THATH|nr:Protein-tyrosine-phosphatase mkp1 [Thalictrum thalictroides]